MAKEKNKKKKSADQVADEFNILSEESIKKLKDPYIAKDQEEWKRIRKAQIDLKNSDTYKQKNFYVPNEAVVNIPVSGTFKNAMQDALNFVLSKLSKEEIVRAMLNIQTNFEGIKDPKQIQPQDMVVWTLMSLLAEFNFQAQEQGKLVYTDEEVGDHISKFMEKLEGDPQYEITPEAINEITKDYKTFVPGSATFVDEEDNKDEKSGTNED